MDGVVSAKGAYALAVKERSDVTTDLVDVVGLIDGDDVKEHGFQAYNCWFIFFFSSFVFYRNNYRLVVIIIRRSSVAQHRRSEMRCVVCRDAATRLKERVLVFDQSHFPFADAEVAVHEVVEREVVVVGCSSSSSCCCCCSCGHFFYPRRF